MGGKRLARPFLTCMSCLLLLLLLLLSTHVPGFSVYIYNCVCASSAVRVSVRESIFVGVGVWAK